MKTTGYNSIKSWGIAVACGFVNCMLQLPKRMSSVLFVAFVVRYDTDRQNAALFITINAVLKCLAGPLAGFFGGIVDLRHLTLVGCLFASLGAGCCYLAEDILAVTIFLGLINGFGVAIGQPLLPQILKQHFSKNIANANGIFNGVSSGLSFAIIPVIAALIHLYEVSGALLITSGIMLHSVPVAMLLKNPRYNNSHIALPVETSRKGGKLQNSLSENSSELKDEDLSNSGKRALSYEYVPAEDTELTKSVLNESNLPESVHKQKYECVFDAVNEKIKIEGPLKEDQQRSSHVSTRPSSSVDRNSTGKENHHNTSNSIPKKDSQSSNLEKRNRYVEAFKTLLVFKDPSFLVIVVCQSLYGYVNVFLYTIVIEISRDKGFLQSQEHVFLMLFPAAEIIGHACLGWVTDKGHLSVSNYNSICFLGMGLACVTFVLSNNYVIILFATMCFGLCYAAICTTTPSLVYEFIEEKQQTMALASRLIFYTPLVFTMAPFIDYYRGTLGSYDGALYLLTGICIVCAVLLLLLPSIAKCSNPKK